MEPGWGGCSSQSQCRDRYDGNYRGYLLPTGLLGGAELAAVMLAQPATTATTVPGKPGPPSAHRAGDANARQQGHTRRWGRPAGDDPAVTRFVAGCCADLARAKVQGARREDSYARGGA